MWANEKFKKTIEEWLNTSLFMLYFVKNAKVNVIARKFILKGLLTGQNCQKSKSCMVLIQLNHKFMRLKAKGEVQASGILKEIKINSEH